jgi:hypothetical protein
MKISNEKLLKGWIVVFFFWGFTPLIISFLFFLPNTFSAYFLPIVTSSLHFIAIIALGCLFFFFTLLEFILFVVMWGRVRNITGKEKMKELLVGLPWNKFLPFVVSIISIGLIVVV